MFRLRYAARNEVFRKIRKGVERVREVLKGRRIDDVIHERDPNPKKDEKGERCKITNIYFESITEGYCLGTALQLASPATWPKPPQRAHLASLGLLEWFCFFLAFFGFPPDFLAAFMVFMDEWAF